MMHMVWQIWAVRSEYVCINVNIYIYVCFYYITKVSKFHEIQEGIIRVFSKVVESNSQI